MKKAYEVESSFIGDPEYFYFESKKDAEKCADYLNNTPSVSAYFGTVKTTAKINEITLQDNQHIEAWEIVTTYRKIYTSR